MAGESLSMPQWKVNFLFCFPGLSATCQALVYAVVDSYVYANWVFPVATAIMFPIWLQFWVVLHSSPHQKE